MQTNQTAARAQRTAAQMKINFQLRQIDLPNNTSRHLTRYIPIVIKRAVLTKTGEKCAHEGCNKPYEILHHVERFAAGGSHKSIIPLCKEHHEFAHNGILKEDRPSKAKKMGGMGGWGDMIGGSATSGNEATGGNGAESGDVGGGAAGGSVTCEEAKIDLLFKKYRRASIEGA